MFEPLAGLCGGSTLSTALARDVDAHRLRRHRASRGGRRPDRDDHRDHQQHRGDHHRLPQEDRLGERDDAGDRQQRSSAGLPALAWSCAADERQAQRPGGAEPEIGRRRRRRDSPSSARRRSASARTSRPPKIRLSPQLSSEASMLTAATRPTAPRPFFGMAASRVDQPLRRRRGRHHVAADRRRTPSAW